MKWFSPNQVHLLPESWTPALTYHRALHFCLSVKSHYRQRAVSTSPQGWAWLGICSSLEQKQSSQEVLQANTWLLTRNLKRSSASLNRSQACKAQILGWVFLTCSSGHALLYFQGYIFLTAMRKPLLQPQLCSQWWPTEGQGQTTTQIPKFSLCLPGWDLFRNTDWNV